MKRFLGLTFLPCLAPVAAQTQARSRPLSATVTVPREKISLTCADSFSKTERTNCILQDEVYPRCTLSLLLALGERWSGRRTFYIIPRVSANLYAKDNRGDGRWLLLSPLVMPGTDALHTTFESSDYKAVELVGKFGKLRAGTRTPGTWAWVAS